MQVAEQDRKFFTLTEALSWIAFRARLDVAGIKERLRSDPACWVTLNEAMQQFSIAAGDGRLKARGRFVTDADKSDHPKAGYIDDIPENQFTDLQQFDLDRERLQYLPTNGSRVLGTWGTSTSIRASDGGKLITTAWLGKAEEYGARAFQSFAGVKEKNRPSYAAGYEKVEVLRSDLVQQFPTIPVAQKTRLGRPSEIDRDAVCARAGELREKHPNISVGAAAASLAFEFGPNPKTEKPWNARGMEKIIAPLWKSGEEK